MANGTRFQLISGFEVEVTALPPYYIDFVDDAIRLVEPPRRKMKLMAGDEVTYEYVPPEEPPDPSNEEEFALYIQYKEMDKQNDNIKRMRDRAKRDFLLLQCVHILSGPMDVMDIEWAARIQAAVPGYVIPSSYEGRLLAFLKSQVLTTEQEFQAVMRVCMYPEVNMQSILNALHGFQNQVGQQGSGGGNG